MRHFGWFPPGVGVLRSGRRGGEHVSVEAAGGGGVEGADRRCERVAGGQVGLLRPPPPLERLPLPRPVAAGWQARGWRRWWLPPSRRRAHPRWRGGVQAPPAGGGPSDGGRPPRPPPPAAIGRACQQCRLPTLAGREGRPAGLPPKGEPRGTVVRGERHPVPVPQRGGAPRPTRGHHSHRGRLWECRAVVECFMTRFMAPLHLPQQKRKTQHSLTLSRCSPVGGVPLPGRAAPREEALGDTVHTNSERNKTALQTQDVHTPWGYPPGAKRKQALPGATPTRWGCLS